MKFAFYGGKGGVGKTTCAAARAVTEAAAGQRVLVVSTDPAHSLRDALGRGLHIRGRGTLTPVEIDARRAFARWTAGHRRALADILEEGTWLDRADVRAFVALPVPGVDELVGLLEITRLARRHRPDLVVVDTAPTGHTLRLLAAPEAVATVARALDALYESHRFVRERFARNAPRVEDGDRLIAALATEAGAIATLLRDRARTCVCWVTLAEAMALAETEDALRALAEDGIEVDEIVVNRVLPPAAPCRLCDRLRTEQHAVIRQIRRRVGGGRCVRMVDAWIQEPRGVRALARLGAALVGSAGGGFERTRPTAETRRLDSGPRRAGPFGPAGARILTSVGTAKLIFVGGKGGVGKTTVAAALAMQLARAHPRRRILLLSTDPAHSIGDVLGTAVDDTPALVRGAPRNMDVREIDAARALDIRRADLEAAFDEALSTFTSQPAGSTRSGTELLRLAPPGIDELFGMLSIVQACERYETIVVDTAPTGHALRLLEAPAVMRAWVDVLLRVLLKYRGIVRPGRFASEIVDMSRTIRALQTLIRDPAATRFLVVTRAAALPRLETERLVARLRRMKLGVPAVLVNAVTVTPGRCGRCRATVSAERRELAALARARAIRSRRCAIIQSPLAAPPPHGPRALLDWCGTWHYGT